jgi:large subunit ribosomal protein L13
MKTFSAKAQDIEHKWYIIDAKDQILGKVAVAAATLLRGKGKTIFTAHVDTGDFVVVINADKVRLTGNKESQKIYTRFSGHVGGQKVETPRKIRQKHPELLVEHAVHGMVPKNRLGRAQMGKLKVYAGASHPHEAQQPEAVVLA